MVIELFAYRWKRLAVVCGRKHGLSPQLLSPDSVALANSQSLLEAPLPALANPSCQL